MVVVPCGQPTGMASVPIQSFCWLEEVTLSGPCTTALIQPQGKLEGFSQKMYRTDEKGRMYYWEASCSGDAKRVYMSTAAVPLKAAPVLDAKATPRERPYMDSSSIATIGGVVANVSQLLFAGAKLAAMVGFCKPAANSRITIDQFNNPASAIHILGDSSCVNVGFANDTTIIPVSGDELGHDELDIRSLVATKSILGVMVWNVTDVVNTVLARYPVNPGYCFTDLSCHHTLLSYVAMLFGLWRGSISYKLIAVKTQFHTGQLLITYFPGIVKAADGTETNVYSAYRVVFDINSQNMVEFSVPYVAPTPFSIVETSVGSNDLGVYTNYGTRSGYIQISVLVPLASAGNVASQSIRVVSLVGGGDDIEFTMPYWHFADADPAPEVPLQAVAQGDTIMQEDVGADLGPIMPALPLSNTPLATCVGERYENLRPLLRMARNFSAETTMSTHTYLWSTIVSFNPAVMHLAGIFAYATGGIRAFMTASDVCYHNVRCNVLSGAAFQCPFDASFPVRVGSMLGVTIPYYQLVPFLPTFSWLNVPITLTVRHGFSINASISGAMSDDGTFFARYGPRATAVPNLHLASGNRFRFWSYS